VDANSSPTLLRGFNVIPVWGSAPGKTWGADSYVKIRATGANTARFVVYWSELEPVRGSFDQTHLATLDLAIARARAAGLYVVLDPIHIYNGEDRVPAWARTGDVINSVKAGAGPYLRMLAARYQDNPAVAAYDLVNEPPSYPIDQNRSLRMYGSLIAEVRQVDPDKILMVEPIYGDSAMTDADFSLLGSTRNVVLSYHDYYAGGGGDDGYRASDGAQEGIYTWDERTGYASPDAAALERHLRVQLDTARRVGIPLWVGEMGINTTAVGADQWIAEKTALFKRYGLGYAWWAYNVGTGMAAMDSNYVFKPFALTLF